MNKDKTKIIFGPPGTGKTTSLLDIVDDSIESGIKPERIAYLSFTRKAAEEGVSRAKAKFKMDDKRFPHFQTIHSLAFSMLRLNSQQVLKQSHYNVVAKKLGMEVNADRARNEDMAYKHTEGDHCLRVYQLSRSREVPLRQVYDEINYDFVNECTFDRVVEFVESLENFKKQFNLLDFNDFLDIVDKKLDVDVLIVDEAQDLTKQQWSFLTRILSDNTKSIIIAGDDDQAIYSWSGAEIQEFLKIEGEKIVLPYSYRLPKTIWDLANTVVKKIKVREEKEWKPRDAVGLIKAINTYDELDLRTGEWLMLARTNRELYEFKKYCRDNGHVYKIFKTWSNQEPPVQAAILYQNFKDGKLLYYKDIKIIMEYVTDPPKVQNRNTPYKFEEIDWPFDPSLDWIKALKSMKQDDRHYIINLRQNNVSLTKPGNIKISTIHGAKGGEAENVVLKLRANQKADEDLHKSRDDEIRVWYVGITRAKENLYLSGDHRFLYEL